MVLDEEAQAKIDVWSYTMGFIHERVVKCAVDFEIPDIIEKHGGPMSLTDLSAAIQCPSDALYRIMRFLTAHKIFKITNGSTNPNPLYAQTPLSRLFARDKMAPYILLHGDPPGPVGGLTVKALRTGTRDDLGHGEVIEQDGAEWTADFKDHGDIFTEAMACHARVTIAAIIENYPGVLKGVGSLVDVGGRNGTAVGSLVKAFPTVKGINFDLPQVVKDAPPRDGVVHVGGDMFVSVPKADAAMLMRVLHDWSDEACVDVLKKCKEAVPAKTGKVIVLDAVIHEEDDEGHDEFEGVRLELDMTMMAVTVKGKERTYKEWVHLLKAAGFSKYKFTSIKAVEFVIEAFA